MLHVTMQDILAAHARFRKSLRETPLVFSPELSRISGGEIWLKLDNLLQPTGSFKLRGAFNKIVTLTDEEKTRGLVAVSSGNHSQAVAWCARELGLDAVIFMGENTPKVKVENTRRHGAQVILKGRDYDEADYYSHEYERETGRVFIHPFNDSVVVAGQGTAALEVLRERPDLDTLVVPVGGGGLISGSGVVARAVNPAIRVIGVQAEVSAPFVHSFKAGHYLKTPINDSLADSLTGAIVSEEFFEFFRQWVDDMVMLTEDEIAEGVWWMLAHHKLAVEGAAASGVAAIIKEKIDLKDKKTGVLITGCGIDMSKLTAIIDRFK
jgi:threonine dehydratase